MSIFCPVFFFSRQAYVLKKPVAAYNFDIWAPLSVHVWVSYAIFIVVLGVLMDLAQLGLKNQPWKFSVMKFSQRIDRIFDFTTGCFCAMYSSFVLTSLMFPKAKPIPFKSGGELSFLVENGQYRLADFHKPAWAPHGSDDSEARFQAGIDKYGYVLTGSTIKEIYDPLTSDSNLIVTGSDTWIFQHFNDFRYHGQLSVIEDPDGGSNWKGYFWNPRFRYKNQINYFLSLSNSGLIETIRRRYLPHTYRRDLTRTNTEQKISLDLFRNLFLMYVGCLLVCIFSALIECFLPIGQKFAENYQKRRNGCH